MSLPLAYTCSSKSKNQVLRLLFSHHILGPYLNYFWISHILNHLCQCVLQVFGWINWGEGSDRLDWHLVFIDKKTAFIAGLFSLFVEMSTWEVTYYGLGVQKTMDLVEQPSRPMLPALTSWSSHLHCVGGLARESWITVSNDYNPFFTSGPPSLF